MFRGVANAAPSAIASDARPLIATEAPKKRNLRCSRNSAVVNMTTAGKAGAAQLAWARVRSASRVIRTNRQRQEKEQAVRAAARRSLAGRDGDKVGAEDDRARNSELGSDEFQRVDGMEREIVPAADIVGGVVKGDPAVRDVPEDIGDDQRRRERNSQHGPGIAGDGARRGRGGDVEGGDQRQVDHGVFGIETEADGETEENCRRHARTLEMRGESQDADRPEEQERHVRRDQQRRDRYPGHQCVDDCGPEADARVIEPGADEVDHEGGRYLQEIGGQAHAGLAVATDRCGRADQPGDQRRLVEVAEVEMLRPGPVLRLVEAELEGRNADRSRAHGKYRRERDAKYDKLSADRCRRRRRRFADRCIGHAWTLEKRGVR